MQKKIMFLMWLALAGFIVAMLAGCGSDSGGGVRATAEALGTRFPGQKTEATATPFPTAPAALQYVESTREVEVTRIVEATVIVTQPANAVEVTREVVVTVTPDVAGFDTSPAIDESAQPCPARFWKRGRCTATQAQIEAAALGNE